jgi:hypothetical protein
MGISAHRIYINEESGMPLEVVAIVTNLLAS